MTASTLSSLSCAPVWATPRRPDRDTLGFGVAQVAKALGTPLMPWQRLVADVALEINPATGRLAYRQIGLTVPRQSGKTTLLLALMVHRAVTYDTAQRIVYTAQTGKDAREKWEDDHLQALERSVFAGKFRARRTNGSEAIIWKNGSYHGIMSPTATGGHGKTLDLGVIDEAFAQVDSRLEQAMKPAMITRPQPQLWVVSTAGTDESVYLKDKVDFGRQAAQQDTGEGFAYFEWSAPDGADPADPDTWASCMPALGYTQTIDAVRGEFNSMKLADFERAFLNRWTRGALDPVIDPAAWDACRDIESKRHGAVVFAFDVAPDRSTSSISVAGARSDGLVHVELVDDRPGTDWLASRLLELAGRWGAPIWADVKGPAGALLVDLADAGLEVNPIGAAELGQACGLFYDAVVQKRLRHRGEPAMSAALNGAAKRPLGDAWAWSRRSSAVSITPLVAATLAHWAHRQNHAPAPVGVVNLADFLEDE